MKLIVHRLRANRISLNVSKTEIFLFQLKKLNRKLSLCLSGQKIIPTIHTGYLGIFADEHFSWNQHLKTLKKKLSRANGLLAKVPYYVSPNLLRTLYFAIFESHLSYGCQIWDRQKSQYITDIDDLHTKAIKITNFKESSIMTFLTFYYQKTAY